MTSVAVRRFGAVIASAVLLASVAVATTASAASAQPMCDGVPATIVGTDGADRIKGTPERDVIVGGGGDDRIRGEDGNDLICGGPGNDRLVGNTGDDVLLGGPGADHIWAGKGDDRLLGGDGRDYMDGRDGHDECVQGPGSGPHYRCEEVAPVKPRNLAIAFSDLDGDKQYGDGDVLISRLFDTNGDGIPSKGDTVYMGKYPVDFEMTAFADWGVDTHIVGSHGGAALHGRPYTFGHAWVHVAGGRFQWYATSSNDRWEAFWEHGSIAKPKPDSTILDTPWQQEIETRQESPSRPAVAVDLPIDVYDPEDDWEDDCWDDDDDWCDEDDDWVEPPPNPDRRYLQVVVYP